MRRAYFGVLVVGVIALLVVGLTRTSSLAYSPGVLPAGPGAVLAAGQVVCQGPLAPAEGTSFDRVALFPAAPGARGEVVVRVVGGGELGSGRLVGSAPVRVGRQQPQSAVEVCVSGAGPEPLTLLGAGGGASPLSEARQDGQPIPTDVAVRLEDEGRPLLALAPAMAQRASRFRPDWVGSWTYGVLAALVVLGVPALLLRALRAAAGDGPLR